MGGQQQGLVRQIGLASGVAIVVGSTIGSGIFKSPSGIAELMPGPLPMLLVWLVGGLIVLCGGLTLGEVGSAYPYSGGLYVYLREAYGRRLAYVFGWAQLVLIRPSSIGAVALVFGQYALRLSPIEEGTPQFTGLSAVLACGAIVIVTLANVVGVKFGTTIQNITTIAKVGGLAVLIVLALTIGLQNGAGHFQPATPEGSFSLSHFGLALIAVLWAYDGWADGSYVGGEMTDPRRNLPRSILFGTIAIIAVYLLANIAYMAVLPVSEIASSGGVAADVMTALFGPVGLTLIVTTVMLSTFGTLNGSVLTSPRIFFALAEDKMFAPKLAEVHPRFKTPYIAVVLAGLLGIVYVLVATKFAGSRAFGALTDAFVIGLVPFYALSVGAVFVFRRRESRRTRTENAPEALSDSLQDPLTPAGTTEHHPYSPATHTPLFPVPPVVFILANLLLLGNSLAGEESRGPTILTLAIVALGFPVYSIALRRQARDTD